MRIFVAGATGAVGRPLVRALAAQGHEVSGTTRRSERGRLIEADGATAVVVDALDTGALTDAVLAARPDVVVDQLTDLPQRFGIRGLRSIYRGQNRLRERGSGALLDAAVAAGARQIITQSVAFLYEPGVDAVRTEADPAWRDAPPPFGRAVSVAAGHDERVIATPGIVGVVLRYGVLYGPGTHFWPGNGIHEDTRRRRLPLIGDSAGRWSFVHVDDAAGAVLAALGRSSSGIYNIVDDDPAPWGEWLPFYADVLGAKPPHRIPRWLGRVAAGPVTTSWVTDRAAVSNAKAKRELGWSPRISSWGVGFRELVT